MLSFGQIALENKFIKDVKFGRLLFKSQFVLLLKSQISSLKQITINLLRILSMMHFLFWVKMEVSDFLIDILALSVLKNTNQLQTSCHVFIILQQFLVLMKTGIFLN